MNIYCVSEGVNGILPNLDLVHVVTHLSEMEGIPSALHVGVSSQHEVCHTSAMQVIMGRA